MLSHAVHNPRSLSTTGEVRSTMKHALLIGTSSAGNKWPKRCWPAAGSCWQLLGLLSPARPIIRAASSKSEAIDRQLVCRLSFRRLSLSTGNRRRTSLTLMLLVAVGSLVHYFVWMFSAPDAMLLYDVWPPFGVLVFLFSGPPHTTATRHTCYISIPSRARTLNRACLILETATA